MSVQNFIIGGFIKQSLIDYPGHIAAVVFTIGCNMRCFYCHNPQLVLPELFKRQPCICTDSVLEWIANRCDLLDAVVISGGEPTLQKGLPDFIRILKGLSLKIKLDTNGTNSQMLKHLIYNQLVDYIAMDIKAPLLIEKYKTIAGESFSEKQLSEIKKSIDLLHSSKIDYEFRTTLSAITTTQDVKTIMTEIKGNYYLQPYNMNNKRVIQPEQIREFEFDFKEIVAYNYLRPQVRIHVRM
ncbi:MAG: anaerobic ribonucleoside-triphosphate reductase activating protein [Bacteroidales bacterium]|nr:anaerobic ribonucleoside-triphosphate reductase activating protein [Bacteroidales bacterium]